MLMAVSGAAFAVFYGVIIWISLTKGHPQVAGSGFSGGNGYIAMTSSVSLDGYVLLLCVIPIVVCGISGLFCLLWLTRKPPKLPKD